MVTMLASCHACGTVHTSHTLMITWCSLLNILSPPCFLTSAGIPSPPGALQSFRPAIALAISGCRHLCGSSPPGLQHPLSVLYTTCCRAVHSSSGVECSFSSHWARALSFPCSKLSLWLMILNVAVLSLVGLLVPCLL